MGKMDGEDRRSYNESRLYLLSLRCPPDDHTKLSSASCHLQFSVSLELQLRAVNLDHA